MGSKRQAERGKLANWFLANGGSTFLSADYLLGVIVASGAAAAIDAHPSVKESADVVLFFEAGLGVAVLSVVLTGLSVLVAFLGEEYIQILNRTPLGIAGAIRPFKIVATVAGTASLVALASAIFLTALPSWAQTTALAVSSGLSVWALVGTIQLVNITAKHGEYRTQLPELSEAFRRGQAERERRANSG